MKPEVLNHFKSNDTLLYSYMVRFPEQLTLEPAKPATYFFRLAREIAFQQLNGKAASSIWEKFINLFPGKKVVPAKVLALDTEQMRTCGLSYAKSQYIKNIATAFMADTNYADLNHLDDEEVIELLTKIKGVGRWTAEMFLMFSLGREDVFSLGDFGLKKGMMKVYKMRKEPTKKRITQITNKWRPYRTYGALALWGVIDIKVWTSTT